MIWDADFARKMFLVFAGVYLAFGGASGALVGLAFGLASRGRFTLKRFVYSCLFGVLGSIAGILVLFLEPSGKLNGLLAEILGPEASWGDLSLMLCPISFALIACVAMSLRTHRVNVVRA
jgi:hypothetical protein